MRVASECVASLSKTMTSMQGFYGSHLPYYLLDRTAPEREHFETAMSGVVAMDPAEDVLRTAGGIK
jgi:hypothetical protein